jgi:hypothetical protein
MKTSDLISALAADAPKPSVSLRSRLMVAIGAGALISLAVLIATFGFRPDISSAARTMRFDFKFVLTLAFLLPSALLCLRLSRPDAEPGALLVWLAVPLVLLLSAVVVELSMVPRELWVARLFGSNWLHCLMMIPVLAVAPLGALIAALRDGAPRYPALTGALAGAAAAGIAATIYASSCPDDSALFVASWYPLATLIVVAAGALAGRRLLQW